MDTFPTNFGEIAALSNISDNTRSIAKTNNTDIQHLGTAEFCRSTPEVP